MDPRPDAENEPAASPAEPPRTPSAPLPVEAVTAPINTEGVADNPTNEDDAPVEAAVSSPLPVPQPEPRERFWTRAGRWARDYFLAFDPTFLSALAPFIVLSIILFARSPATNYIFDEQEALLANPYVNATGGLRFIDAIHRDFWGLPPDRSV